jgi:3-phosphoglycerate kinase
LNESGQVSETFRLDASIPTLKFLMDHEVFPVIMGHMGRPEGAYKEELSTKQLIPYFENTLGKGKFELLENLRFDKREEENDLEFAKELAGKADFYVNESFATCHRKAASITGVAAILPAYAGLRLEQEVATLSKIMVEPERPFVAIVGGVKIESKKPVISKFLEVCDHVLVGGKIGMEWTDLVPENLFLPIDYAEDSKDIGDNTIAKFKEVLSSAKSVIWSGPLGYCEGGFDKGTKEVAQAVIDSGAHSIIGGGDTVATMNTLGCLAKFDFASTGGGAMLQFLVEGTLPGIEALN